MKTLLKKIFITMVACLAGSSVGTTAQLAITEVMSSASTNLGPNQVTQNSDYWELTNFGTNAVPLTGYKFDDSDNNLAAADPTPFDGLMIGPGESIVFVQNNVNTNDVSFREWWGTNVPPSIKIVFYGGNGLSSGGDGIRVWGPSALDAADVVDSVDFSEAIRGASFTYDQATGEFGVVSTNGVNGAFHAETTDDVGSPGRTTGPTPPRIIQNPTDTVVNPGDTATFKVVVGGRPRGFLQWYFGETPLSGATNATLQILNAQSANAGEYHVAVNNTLATINSAAARLVLASEATAPVLTQTPSNLTLYVGQGFTFKAVATGVPQPTFQWQVNGRDVNGAAGAELALANVTVQDSGSYSVIARNAIGAATNTFQVTVTEKPQLAITEVMSSSSTNVAGHGDWWELTNLGSAPVNLTGLRFDDNSEMLSAAFTFTNAFSIAPNESIVFVESMTPDEFRNWWGPEFLLPNLQILTYRGNGLSSAGDAVNLWNAAASEDSDKLASAVFSTATGGVSFGYNPDSAQFGELSSAGQNGVFTANSGGDVGSPGYIRNSQRVILPRLKSITLAGANLVLAWNSEPGTKYSLQSKGQLSDATWTTEKELTASTTETQVEVVFASSIGQRFYRLQATP